MPIYNGIEFIDESVNSVISQTFIHWELIIAINGHPENSSVYKTAKKLEQVSPKIKVYDMFQIKGKANTLNAMIPLIKYEYVAILDVDDVWHNEKLERQRNLIPTFDVVGSQCVYFGDINGVIPGTPCGNLKNVDFSIGNPVINSSAIIKKKHCKWIENGIEDYDLWLRLKKRGCDFYNVPSVLVYHRIHNTSAFNSKGHSVQLQNLLSKKDND
jgi:glycosyltransferase involved in cell wall biosynthesis